MTKSSFNILLTQKAYISEMSIEDFSEKVERRKKAQSRLKSMGSCGVCDFSFLQECWADLGLRIAVKIQLRKRPEWRVAVIDEQLHQFDVDF